MPSMGAYQRASESPISLTYRWISFTSARLMHLAMMVLALIL